MSEGLFGYPMNVTLSAIVPLENKVRLLQSAKFLLPELCVVGRNAVRRLAV
jgi:hypothetical protein